MALHLIRTPECTFTKNMEKNPHHDSNKYISNVPDSSGTIHAWVSKVLDVKHCNNKQHTLIMYYIALSVPHCLLHPNTHTHTHIHTRNPSLTLPVSYCQGGLCTVQLMKQNCSTDESRFVFTVPVYTVKMHLLSSWSITSSSVIETQMWLSLIVIVKLNFISCHYEFYVLYFMVVSYLAPRRYWFLG